MYALYSFLLSGQYCVDICFFEAIGQRDSSLDFIYISQELFVASDNGLPPASAGGTNNDKRDYAYKLRCLIGGYLPLAQILTDQPDLK